MSEASDDFEYLRPGSEKKFGIMATRVNRGRLRPTPYPPPDDMTIEGDLYQEVCRLAAEAGEDSYTYIQKAIALRQEHDHSTTQPIINEHEMVTALKQLLSATPTDTEEAVEVIALLITTAIDALNSPNNT